MQQLQPLSLFPQLSKPETTASNCGASNAWQIDRLLLARVMDLLHSDRELAMRLISQIKIKNPNRSMNWCTEKVIYDLERDRGNY